MGIWEVQLAGSWKSLGKVVGTACNEAKERGATQLKFVSHGQEYLIDFEFMVQQNVKSGKTRPVRENTRAHKGARKSPPRHGGAVHVHPAPSAPPAADTYPSIHPPAPGAGSFTPPKPAGRVTTPPKPATPEKKSSFLGRWLGRGALVTAAAAAGTGIAVVGGVCDIGDITEAAEEMGDILGDAAEDAAEAAADAAGVAHDTAVDLAAAGSAAADAAAPGLTDAAGHARDAAADLAAAASAAAGAAAGDGATIDLV